MKSVSIIKVLMFLLLFCGSSAFSQTANAEQNQNENQVMSENDRIPFMQTEEAVKTQDASGGSLILRTFGAMLLIVGLIFFGAWGMKKLGFANSPVKLLSDAPELSVLNSVNLGNGRTISAVKFGEKVLLVGSTSQSFTLLAEDFGKENIAENNPRSVADLLAEENFDFEAELTEAQKRLGLNVEKGEKV